MSITFNKIACSLNNTAAIGQNGEIYVWGSGKYGLTCSEDTNSCVAPFDIKIQRKNQFYQAIHVSCGLYHMAAIVKNSIIDKIDSKREPSEIYKRILEKQKNVIFDKGIDILKQFDIETYPDGFIPAANFRKFINSELNTSICDYSPEENKSLQEFIYYFSLDVPDKANILQYYYFIYNDEKYFSAYIWGIPNNGRLGLSEALINQNENVKIKKTEAQSKGKPERNNNSDIVDDTKSYFEEGDALSGSKNKIRRILPTKIDFKLNNVNVIKIACGHHHTMALDERFILYTWGMGSQGCLGNGKLSDIFEPTPINNIQMKATYSFDNDQDIKFKDIACGSYHSMALAVSEDLFTWGANSRGQLGHSNTNNTMKPRKIDTFIEQKIGLLAIAAGDQHSAAISSNNELYTWGCGAYYRLGHGLTFDELTPKKVEVLEDVYVTQVSCGVSHTLCITNEGFIYGWGNGMCGKLGIEEKCTKNYILPTRIGTYLRKFRRKQFQEVCAGPLHSLTLTDDGIIYSWGSAKNGILGLDRRNEDVYLPTKISTFRFSHKNFGKREESNIKFLNIYFLKQYYSPDKILYNENDVKISALTCSVKNTFFLTQEGKLFCSGSNQFGLMVRNPLKTKNLILEHVNAITGTNMNNTDKKESFAFGTPLYPGGESGPSGKSLIDEKEQRFKEKLEKDWAPSPIHYFKKKIVFIACSYNHALAINESGRVYTWGANSDYQLGLGFPSKYEYIPQQLSGALETKFIKMAACSEKSSALLTDLGEVWTFGTSEQGCLGHEEKNSYIIPIPKMINDIPSMIFIACGPEHMMSVSAYKHELYAWGNNIYGQLGIRATGINSGFNEHKEKTASDIRVYKPNQVPLIIGDINLKVEMVALGMYHSVLLSTDKYLYSCGLKKYAGIQLNDLTQPFEFLDIFTLILKLRNTKFKMIASGEFHSLALSENNDVYGWGSCLFGRLGEKFWKEGEEAILEENENEIKRIGAAEDIKLIELPELLYENPSRKSNKEMKFVGCGPTHSASINKHGEVFTWGSGICGKLGVKLEDFFTVTAFEKPEDKVDELKKRKKISSFVMPKNRVFFKYKKDKQEETQGTIIRATTSKTGNLEKTASATRYSPTRPPKLLDTALDRKKEEDLNQHSDNDKKDDSEMLIRENSSIDSDDQLDIPDNIKTQLPRDSFLNNTQSVIRDRKSFIKSQLDDTTFTIQKKINLQDKLQKELFLEKGELKEERLMAEDNELEKILRVLVERKLKIALNLKKEYNIALNRIDAVIYARMNIINQQSQNIPFLKNIQHKVPTFILQNIQLYETVFSFLKLHPCYIMSIISTHLLNNSQVNQLINILYNNPISTTSSICSLISLSQMVFDFEIKNYFKITEIKNFKIGSIFWQIYLIMFFKQEENKIFLISFAKTIILELFCKYYYDEENLASKASDFERNKIMQKALEFQEEEFQVQGFEEESKNVKLLSHLQTIIQNINKFFVNRISVKTKSFISKELTYLHSSIIEIYKKNEIRKAREEFEENNEFEIVREDEKQRFKNKLNPFQQRLESNSEVFINNLYFGVLIHIIQNYEQFDIIIPKDHQAFIEKSNNLKILSELIEKFFAEEAYTDEKKFKSINELILNQNEENNKAIFKRLTEYDYFNLTLSHLVETLTNDFDYRMIVYEVSLEFLFILHNLFCKSIKTLPLDTFLLREKDQDPLYIIFKYLNFEEIPINDYNSDTLRMNINLRTDSKLLLYSQISNNTNNNDKFQFYRCQNCNILLPKSLLAQDHSSKISLLEQKGWICVCKQDNFINDFRCKSPSCNRVIPIEDFNYLSIINKYYQEADPLQYLFLDVLKNVDLIKMDKVILNEINENMERAKKREDNTLVGKITEFLRQLEEKVEGTDSRLQKKKKDKVYNLICEKLRDNGLLLIKKRQDHRKYQIYLRETLNSLDLISRERILCFKGAIADLMKTEELILPNFSDKKNKFNVTNKEEEEEMHLDIQNTIDHLKNKQFNSFGVYTSSELFSNKTLRSCKFTNMDIPKILKHLKFYISSTDEGGFIIKVVYLNEHWLNIFIRCLKGYFFKEVTLQTCTFGSEKVSASFNVFYLLKILREIESQVLIQYNTEIKNKRKK